MSERAISIVVHGEAKVGKSTFASTAPTPMLYLDGENASRFLRRPDQTPFRRKSWNPMTEAPPKNDGSWDLCVVKVKNWAVAEKARDYLKTGNHEFRSVVLDSISEIQDKLKKSILEGTGTTQLKMQDWGRLLQSMAAFLRDFRDLSTDEDTTIEAIVILAMSRKIDGTMKPHLEGQVVQQVPYLYDITSYLYKTQVRDETTGEVSDQRFLLTDGQSGFEAGNRVHFSRDTGQDVIANPNIENILDMIFGPRPE